MRNLEKLKILARYGGERLLIIIRPGAPGPMDWDVSSPEAVRHSYARECAYEEEDGNDKGVLKNALEAGLKDNSYETFKTVLEKERGALPSINELYGKYLVKADTGE